MATGQDLVDFWKAVPVTAFPELRSLSVKFVCRFGTTYRSKQTFSAMKFIKSSYRTRLTHAHLEVLMKLAVTDLQPRLEDWVKKEHSPRARIERLKMKRIKCFLCVLTATPEEYLAL